MKTSRRPLRNLSTLVAGACFIFASAAPARAADSYLSQARSLYGQGQYFRAARYAFASLESASAPKSEAYAWVTLSLAHAKLYNSASYFFVKTLQSGDRAAIRRVLTQAEPLLQNVGADLLRKYMIQNTNLDDYDGHNRAAFLYAIGKQELLAGANDRAIGFLNGVSPDSPLWPYALELRATAAAIRGDLTRAADDFDVCASHANQITGGLDTASARYTQAKSEAEDLSARCQAGKARTLYEANQFDAADRAYDRIPKASIVWPDILFEQAWNSFARGEYNRTLGKLVSYKSPALSFVFNPETDVLRAQSYLALCRYDDANQVINEFNGKYAGVGEEVKRFVESRANDPMMFYQRGKEVLAEPLSSDHEFNRMMNRFIRGPYFTGLVRAEGDIASEAEAIRMFDRSGGRDPGHGFPGFLTQVLGWRTHSVRLLGGLFVKNSLLDYHSELISNFEKVSFIKLEMLKRAKDQLVYKNASKGGRLVGSIIPSRRDYQYYWEFNGEFWGDELGDYVFGLESQCRTHEGGAS